MATSPLITFKAGRCDVNGRSVKPILEPGYLYLYEGEDEMMHLCWRPRSAPTTEPTIDLLMIPSDGHFYPLVKEEGTDELQSPTNGRIFVLKFSSSNQKYYFWMQSKTQSRSGDLSWFSQRDQRLGQIVDALLQGEDVDVASEIEDLRRGGAEGDDDDEGDAMDTDDGAAGDRPTTGGAPNRQGGGGGRAANSSLTAPQDQETSSLVQNFLNSLQGGNGGSNVAPSQQADKPFTTLPDLLPPSITTSFISTASTSQIDKLCSHLPADIFLLHQESASTTATEPTPAQTQAAIAALSVEQKREILHRVLHSPQLQQSLGSLTVALRDGGLPMIGDALGLQVTNGGRMSASSSLPLGGGAAVEAFVDAVKKRARSESENDA